MGKKKEKLKIVFAAIPVDEIRSVQWMTIESDICDLHGYTGAINGKIEFGGF